MTNKTVLSEFQLDNLAVNHMGRRLDVYELSFAEGVVQAVLQSPEIQQLEKRLKDALDVLHEIGSEIQEESEGDTWRLSNIARDEYDRQNAIDAAMEVINERS